MQDEERGWFLIFPNASFVTLRTALMRAFGHSFSSPIDTQHTSVFDEVVALLVADPCASPTWSWLQGINV